MSVCIYIYLYREKSYTTGLAFIRYSSGVCKGQSRVMQPQMNCNYSTTAKPTVFAVYSVARRREPLAITPPLQPLCWHQVKQARGSAVSLLVPHVQQTRNASPPGLFLIGTAFLMPQMEFTIPQEHSASLPISVGAALGGSVQLWFVRKREAAATGTLWVTIYSNGSAGPDFKGAKVSFLYVPAGNYLPGQLIKFKSMSALQMQLSR